jgi:hypothetical protein
MRWQGRETTAKSLAVLGEPAVAPLLVELHANAFMPTIPLLIRALGDIDEQLSHSSPPCNSPILMYGRPPRSRSGFSKIPAPFSH